MRITCKQAAELANEAEHRVLSRRERLTLSLHLRLCRCTICRQFSDQLTAMKRAYRQLSRRQAQGSVSSEEGLSERAKERIQGALDAQAE